jgi:hypothetical protein
MLQRNAFCLSTQHSAQRQRPSLSLGILSTALFDTALAAAAEPGVLAIATLALRALFRLRPGRTFDFLWIVLSWHFDWLHLRT